MVPKRIKNIASNVIFVLVLAMLIYSPSREWFMRQIAFAPGIKGVEKSEQIEDYEWGLKGLNTENINFSDFEGKVVFVNFWATWCPPCRAEMPMIQQFYNNFKDKIAFVFVTSEDWSEVQNYFKEKDYNIPVYNSIGRPPEALTTTSSIPASYLISKQGEIRISKVGAADWSSTKVTNLVNDLLKE